MALCVNLEVQEALEELRYAVQLEPDSFIARLKLGELLMRLRICSEAAEHTHAASQLARSSIAVRAGTQTSIGDQNNATRRRRARRLPQADIGVRRQENVGLHARISPNQKLGQRCGNRCPISYNSRC